MKINYILISLTVFLTLTQTSHAQFLKKLKKRVEQKVENVIVEKAAEKAAKEASKSMDNILSIDPFGGASGKKADPILVADVYEFSWKYALKMTTKKGDVVFDYYLEPDASYFGFTTSASDATDMFTVMDTGQEIMATFMKSEENNRGMVSSMPGDLDLEDEENGTENFTFEALPEKTINGYRCKGIKGTSDDYELTMYLTNEVEVSFSDIYKKGNTKIPLNLQDYFGPDEKVLMIYMDMKSLTKKKQDITMECIGLENESKTINKSDYKFM